MNEKLKIFISSVQSEFAKERKSLAAYIREDVMLGEFFEVFLFEEQPARSRSAQAVYLDDYIYRAHDSIPRNRLIARAMSWTSYVEKSGSGTGVIVDKCVEQGLSRPDFDPTVGFFKTVIWREGTKSAPSQGTKSNGLVTGACHERSSRRGRVEGAESKGPSQRGPICRGPVARAQSQGPSQGHCLILQAVGKFGETAISQIAHEFGKVRASGSLKRRLLALLEDGFVEYTIPDKPNSRLQKYRLTAKGRTLAEGLTAKKGKAVK